LSGLALDRCPAGGAQVGGERFEAMGMGVNEIDVENPGLAAGRCLIVGLDERFHDALERREVAAYSDLEVVRADRS